MSDLSVTEIKAFVPSRDWALCKRFYQDLGFTMASEGGGVAYFHRDHAADHVARGFCASDSEIAYADVIAGLGPGIDRCAGCFRNFPYFFDSGFALLSVRDSGQCDPDQCA